VYAPPTRRNCRVESRRRCVRNSQLVGDSIEESKQICQQRSRVASYVGGVNAPVGIVVTQFTISCAVELLRSVTSDGIMTSSLKQLSVSITIHVVKPLRSLFGQFPNCRPNPSAVVVSQLRIPTHSRRDTTRQVESRRRRRCVLGIIISSVHYFIRILSVFLSRHIIIIIMHKIVQLKYFLNKEQNSEKYCNYNSSSLHYFSFISRPQYQINCKKA